MKAIVRQIPNAITCLNLLSGCVGLTFVAQMDTFGFDDQLIMACGFIFLAAFFDFLDGTAARVLNAKSSIGKDLDSLADVISFGLLPSFILYQLIRVSYTSEVVHYPPALAALPAFAIVLFSALRLARFNNDPSQSVHFKGLPTPANAIFWASLVISIAQCSPDISSWTDCNHPRRYFAPTTHPGIAPVFDQCPTLLSFIMYHPWVLYGLIAGTSLLLLAPIRLMSFKVMNFSLKKYTWHILMLVCSGIAAIFLGFAAAPIILALYFLFSFIYFRVNPQEA